MPRYNHLVTIAFSIVSNDAHGVDFTPAMLKEALFARIRDLDSSTDGVEWLEAVDVQCDTYEEEPLTVSDP